MTLLLDHAYAFRVFKGQDNLFIYFTMLEPYMFINRKPHNVNSYCYCKHNRFFALF